MGTSSPAVDDAWFDDPGSLLIRKLLPIAMHALQAEYQRLALAFHQRPGPVDDVAPGLSYRAYEQILQYEIFKAWLPLARVDWDARCSADRGDARRLDLCVHDGTDRIGFELTWWGSSSQRITAARAKGVAADGVVNEAYLVVFWWGADGAWQRELDHAIAHHGRDARLVYLARFATGGPATGDLTGRRHFTMAAFRVAGSGSGAGGVAS
jgi:hypothetical protein